MNYGREAEAVLGNLLMALDTMEECPEFAALIPEVRVNLVYALPEARGPGDVAAVEGRITAVRGRPYASGLPRFGASDHMARLIIETRKYAPDVNAGINFKCDEEIIAIAREYAREKRLGFGWIDRTKEPLEASRKDRQSMPWKIKWLLTQYGSVPHLFYEGDGWGKEPLFVALGRDAVEVVQIGTDIARLYRQKYG